MGAASDGGSSGIGGASMEATDEAGDKGADDAEAGEDGIATKEGGWSACGGHEQARFGPKQRANTAVEAEAEAAPRRGRLT